MTVKTNRPRVIKSAEDRRRDIMEAAVAVFAGKGVAGATVADITHAAGVAKGTFYLYFDSKEHVVAALRERFVAELTGHAAPFIEAIGRVDWWDLAHAVAQDMVDWTLAHRDICAVIMQTYAPETHDIVQEADLSLIRLMATGIRAGIEAGAFHVDDPDLAAAFLYNGTIFTVLQQILHGGPIDRDRLVRTAIELHRKILSPPPPEGTADVPPS